MSERSNANVPRYSSLFLATVGVLEVVVASLVVVGTFAALSQPFGWSSAGQLLTCGLLAVLLWFADRSLIVEPAPVAESSRTRSTVR